MRTYIPLIAIIIAATLTGCAALLEGEQRALDVASKGITRYCAEMAVAASDATRQRWRDSIEASTGAKVSIVCPGDK